MILLSQDFYSFFFFLLIPGVITSHRQVNIYEKKYAEICREVEGLLAIKQRFEVDIEAKKREFDISIKEQDSRFSLFLMFL